MGMKVRDVGVIGPFSDPVPYPSTDIKLQRVSFIRVPRTVVKLFMAEKIRGAGVIEPFF